MSHRVISALLLALALLLVCALKYTYTSHFRSQSPKKTNRMHTRALFFLFLTCVGLLLVTQAYMIGTGHLRETCARRAAEPRAPLPMESAAAPPAAPPEVSVSADGQGFRPLEPVSGTDAS